MNINENSKHIDLEFPFDFEEDDNEEDEYFVDMTHFTQIEGEPVRVELRRVRKPSAAPLSYPLSKYLPASDYIVGLVNKGDLPEEGKNFQLPYHLLNNITDFGVVDSKEEIQDLEFKNDCYFFSTSEGTWRVKILDIGN